MSSQPAADPATSAAVPTGGERPPRPAATIVVLRDGARGIEVLLSRRAERGDHNSGAWVFPGGIVEPGDALARGACDGLSDDEASRRLGLPRGGLAYWVAAIRECFEESGLLFARGDGDALVDLDGSDAARLSPWRIALHRCEKSIVDFCAAERLRLAVERLVYLSHWLTPLGRPKRFDTRFFIAAAPAAQTAAHDGTELVEQLWIAPQEALARSASLKLLTPTQKTLETIARFATVAEAMAWASAPRDVALVMPRVGNGRDFVIEGDEPVDLRNDLSLLIKPPLSCIVHRLADAPVMQGGALLDQPDRVACPRPLQPKVSHPLLDDVRWYCPVQISSPRPYMGGATPNTTNREHPTAPGAVTIDGSPRNADGDGG